MFKLAVACLVSCSALPMEMMAADDSCDFWQAWHSLHQERDSLNKFLGSTRREESDKLEEVWTSIAKQSSFNRLLRQSQKALISEALQKWLMNCSDACLYWSIEEMYNQMRRMMLQYNAWQLSLFTSQLALARARSPLLMRQVALEMRSQRLHGHVVGMNTPVKHEHFLSQAINDLKQAGLWNVARKTYAQVMGMKAPPRWHHFNETAGIVWHSPLVSLEDWTHHRSLTLVSTVLRRARPILIQETRHLVDAGQWIMDDAYPTYQVNKTWQSLLLYDCWKGGWQIDACTKVPRSCAALQRNASQRPWLATEAHKSLCVFPHIERVGIFAIEPNSSVPLHGTHTASINVHMGLFGVEGARLVVGRKTMFWDSVGSILAFQDSFDHSVIHEGRQPRFVFIASVLHPQARLGPAAKS